MKQEELEKIKKQIKEYEGKIINLDNGLIILNRFKEIKEKIPCAHSSNEMLVPAYYLLTECVNLDGDIVELGSYKGGSTAKLSIIAKKLGKKLYVFDSFEGLPENKENMTKTNMGYTADLREGEFCGRLDEVKNYVKKYGEIDACIFIKGWYEDTLPKFKEKICAISCDVDLIESTKTCFKYMFPLLVKDGFFFSQDFHFPLINKFFNEQDIKIIKLTERFGYFRK